MWIENLPNGKFKFVERYTDPLTDKDRKVSVTMTKNTSHTRKEALQILTDKIDEKLLKSAVDLTFEELASKYMEVYKDTVKPSTFSSASSFLKVVLKIIGDIPLNKISARHINDYLFTELDKNTYDTVRQKKIIIEKILRFAIENDYLSDATILTKINLPRKNLSKRDEFKYLEKDELQLLIKQLEDNGKYMQARISQLLALTGMRYGELVALDYSKHIDMENETILIERTFYSSLATYSTPKTGESRRIHFNKEVKQILNVQIKYDQMLMIKYNLDRDNTLLFRTYTDTPYSLPSFNIMLKKYTDIPGKNVTSHYFRHTFITMMLEKGVDAKLIAEHVGHADTNMINQVYFHFSKKMSKRLEAAINDISIM